MAFIHLDDDTTLIRKYSVAGTATKSVIRVEIECSDPWDLGNLLRGIEQAKKELAATKVPPATPPKVKAARKALPAPPRLLTYRETV